MLPVFLAALPRLPGLPPSQAGNRQREADEASEDGDELREGEDGRS